MGEGMHMAREADPIGAGKRFEETLRRCGHVNQVAGPHLRTSILASTPASISASISSLISASPHERLARWRHQAGLFTPGPSHQAGLYMQLNCELSRELNPARLASSTRQRLLSK